VCDRIVGEPFREKSSSLWFATINLPVYMRFFPWKRTDCPAPFQNRILEFKGVLFRFFKTLKVFFAVVLFFSHGFYRRVQANGFIKGGLPQEHA
jgi:hypothetical protein